MWLYVRVLGAEELLGTVDRELLDLVDDLAAAVVAFARIALRVLVRRHRADGLEHGRPREVLGGDQLDLATLAVELLAEQAGDVRVDLVEPGSDEMLEGLFCDRHRPLLSLGWGMVLGAQAGACRTSERPLPTATTASSSRCSARRSTEPRSAARIHGVWSFVRPERVRRVRAPQRPARR